MSTLAAVTQLNSDLDAFLTFLSGQATQGNINPLACNAAAGSAGFPLGGFYVQIVNTIYPDLVASASANGDPAPQFIPPPID